MELFVFARFHARPTRENAVEDALRNLVNVSREEAGCLGIQVFRSTQNARLFYAHSHWENEGTFETHVRSPHTLRFVEHVKSLIDHPLEVTRAELIS